MNASMPQPSSSSSSTGVPPPLSSSISSSPFGLATGLALDVIVIVPASSSSTAGGITSSSDFYVTFPPNFASSSSSTAVADSSVLSSSQVRKAKSAGSLVSKSATRRLSRRSFLRSSMSDSISELDGVDSPAAIATVLERNNQQNCLDSKESHSDSPIQQHNKHYGSTTTPPPSPMSPTSTSTPLDRTETKSESDVFSNAQPESNVYTTTPDNDTKQTESVDPFSTQCPRKILPKRRVGNVQIRINGRYVPEMDMIFTSKQSSNVSSSSVTNSFTLFGIGIGGNNNNSNSNDEMTTCRFVNGNELRPPTEALSVLLTILTYGRNHIRYTLLSSQTGGNLVTAEAHLYLWKSIDSVIVSDVDGTITRSDIRGVIDNFQEKYEHVHDGICKFYHALMDAGNNRSRTDFGIDEHHDYNSPLHNKVGGEVRFLYLTSRPIRIVNQTRKLLVSLSQTCPSKTQKNGLPPGPIMCHRSTLTAVLYGELIAKNMYLFKSEVLSQQVVMPFVTARGEVNSKSRSRAITSSDEPWSPNSENADVNDNFGNDRTYSGMSADSSTWDDRLFVAGFGNKLSDAIAYEMAGMDRRDIYIIDKDSRIRCMSGSMKEAYDDSGIMRQESDSSGNWIPILAQSFQAGKEFSPEIVLDRKQLLSEEQPLSVGAKPIHSIEVTDHNVAEGRQFESHETPDDLITSTKSRATTVDVYVVSDKKDQGNSKNQSENTKWAKVRQSVRPFSTFKKSLIERLPSYGSFSSIDGIKLPTKNYVYEGYDDPRLFDYIRERLSTIDGT